MKHKKLISAAIPGIILGLSAYLATPAKTIPLYQTRQTTAHSLETKLSEKNESKETVSSPSPNADFSYKTNDFSSDSDSILMARMLFGEARNCSKTEMVAIAYTAMNRANDGIDRNGRTIKEAILKPFQYSCFNRNDPNLPKLKNPEKYDAEKFRECLKLSNEVLSGKYSDFSHGATHYHTINSNPTWKNKIHKIGRLTDKNGKLSKHIFYREN